jgi:hypothetical protein
MNVRLDFGSIDKDTPIPTIEGRIKDAQGEK